MYGFECNEWQNHASLFPGEYWRRARTKDLRLGLLKHLLQQLFGQFETNTGYRANILLCLQIISFPFNWNKFCTVDIINVISNMYNMSVLVSLLHGCMWNGKTNLGKTSFYWHLKKWCFYLFILCFLGCRLRIWNWFVATGIGNPIFFDFFWFLLENYSRRPAGSPWFWGGKEA